MVYEVEREEEQEAGATKGLERKHGLERKEVARVRTRGV